MPKKLILAITRPEQQGLKLQQALEQVGISSICQPLFSYQLNTNKTLIQEKIATLSPNIIIFVSTAAVKYADQALPLKRWILPQQHVLAVGRATQQLLKQKNIDAISPEQSDSEGLLALPLLQIEKSNNAKSILIVRGNGGREFLAEQLTERGAYVQYLESYQRIWSELTNEQLTLWHNKKINGIVITSNALLKRVVNLIDITDNYWQNTCLWIVASNRIAQSAINMGLKNVINTQGADTKAIVTTLLNMEPKND